MVVLVVKNLPVNARDIRDAASIPGLGRHPGGRNDSLFYCSFLENLMVRRPWRVWSNLACTHTCTHIYVCVCVCIYIYMKWGEEKVAQSCLTLWDPEDHTVLGILQPEILEWVAFPSSRVSSQPMDWTQASCTVGRSFTSWAMREACVCTHTYTHTHT